jgi:hypothetical protein
MQLTEQYSVRNARMAHSLRSIIALLVFPQALSCLDDVGPKTCFVVVEKKELFFAPRSPVDYSFAPIVVRDEPPNELFVGFVQQMAGEGNAVERTPSRLACLLSNVGSE